MEHSLEFKAYQLLCDHLKERKFSAEHLSFESKSTYSTISYFSSNIVCLLKMSGKKKYCSFSSKYKNLFQDVAIESIPSDPERFRVSLSSAEEILNYTEQIIYILEHFSVPYTFDCCSRYMQCSDQMKCIHPDQLHALECSYRQKLLNGICFFGENRNI